MNPAPETLKLAVGEPHTIALQYADGKPVQSRFSGDQLMFSLVDGRKLYLEPYVADRLRAARVQPNVPFEIEKVETFQGNRRSVEIQVRELKNGASARQTTPAPALQGASAKTHQQTSPNVTPPAPAPQPPPPPAAMNGAGETLADLYLASFATAVDVALRGVELAKARGLHILPAFEDVRTIATCLHLGRTR
jgi:hypothetical protein